MPKLSPKMFSSIPSALAQRNSQRAVNRKLITGTAFAGAEKAAVVNPVFADGVRGSSTVSSGT
ncbi:MAG: hypothetical protein ACLU99_13290 [Alphaproteobacteria bacterium]